ncbi:MAG: glycoside hydrolase, partial [Gemmatimonadota bacterium]|nr:glycoside hydrolase [Gemmatimonadota bacterium]
HAAWWQPRENASAALVVSRSSDGGTRWSEPLIADARDTGRDGCDRPAPAIAADSVTGYVHLVYFARPREGAGVWYTHSMDSGATFHSTTGLIFGDEPVRAGVASDGMLLVAAYEMPHARPARIGVALSRTAGHTFEARVPASEGRVASTEPRVAARDGSFAIAWTERGTGRASAGRTFVRSGSLIPE